MRASAASRLSATLGGQGRAPAQTRIATGLIAGLLLMMALVVVTMIEYPPTMASTSGSSPYLAYGAIALVLLAATAGAVYMTLLRPGSQLRSEQLLALRWGSWVGLACGLLWIVEIAYNNLLAPLAPEYNTARIRDSVDNVFWAIIVLLTLVFAARLAYRTRSIRMGIRVGTLSGLLSGLFAGIMALLLVTTSIHSLTSDPLVLAEYAVRGPSSGAPDLAHYVAYDTLAGALGHLLVLGVLSGALLGALAGAIGRGLRHLRDRRQSEAGSGRPTFEE